MEIKKWFWKKKKRKKKRAMTEFWTFQQAVISWQFLPPLTNSIDKYFHQLVLNIMFTNWIHFNLISSFSFLLYFPSRSVAYFRNQSLPLHRVLRKIIPQFSWNFRYFCYNSFLIRAVLQLNVLFFLFWVSFKMVFPKGMMVSIYLQFCIFVDWTDSLSVFPSQIVDP